jgi:proteasome lid subunit RPN8/RPN11
MSMWMSPRQTATASSPATLAWPKVVIPRDVWDKMMSYVLACPVEVNGFGYTEIRDGVIYVTDVFILAQTVSAAHAETDPRALDEHLTYMREAGMDPGCMRFQWHSHVNMDAYFSGTDLENINNWVGNLLVSVVVNKLGEYSCRLDTYRDGIRIGMQVTPEIKHYVDPQLHAAAVRDIGQLVRVSAPILRRSKRVQPATAPGVYTEPLAVTRPEGDNT